MTRDDIALIVLHALMSNPNETQRPLSDVFDIADMFIQEAEKRNDIEEGS